MRGLSGRLVRLPSDFHDEGGRVVRVVEDGACASGSVVVPGSSREAVLVHEFAEDGVGDGAVDGRLVHECVVEGIMHDGGCEQGDGGDADGGSIPDISAVQDEF